MDEQPYVIRVIPDGGTMAAELLDELAAGPPAWMRDALCREPHPGANWFPERGEDASRAKAVCRRCLVREECLAYAGLDPDLRGIWGGLSDRQRRQRRQAAPKPERTPRPAPRPPRPPLPPPDHGDRRMYWSGCRCAVCRAGNAAAKAEYKRRARAS